MSSCRHAIECSFTRLPSKHSTATSICGPVVLSVRHTSLDAAVDGAVPALHPNSQVSPVRMVLAVQLPMFPNAGESTSSIEHGAPAVENIHESDQPSETMYESPEIVVAVSCVWKCTNRDVPVDEKPPIANPSMGGCRITLQSCGSSLHVKSP